MKTYQELEEENQLLKDLLVRSCKVAQLRADQVDSLLGVIRYLSKRLPEPVEPICVEPS